MIIWGFHIMTLNFFTSHYFQVSHLPLGHPTPKEKNRKKIKEGRKKERKNEEKKESKRRKKSLICVAHILTHRSMVTISDKLLKKTESFPTCTLHRNHILWRNYTSAYLFQFFSSNLNCLGPILCLRVNMMKRNKDGTELKVSHSHLLPFIVLEWGDVSAHLCNHERTDRCNHSHYGCV